MIDLRPDNIHEPQRGRLLISEPFLDDPYFKRTVVLLCEHNERGSFGFVLNRYIDIGVDEILEDMPSLDTRISVGGPVQNTDLFYLHTLGEEVAGSEKIVEGIYMGGEFDVLKEKIRNKIVTGQQIRFFVGYSGWSEGQLEQELKEKAWLVAPLGDTELMDTDENKLWASTIRSLGDGFKHLANIPEDPSMN